MMKAKATSAGDVPSTNLERPSKADAAMSALHDENRVLRGIVDRLRGDVRDGRKRCGELELAVATYAAIQDNLQVSLYEFCRWSCCLGCVAIRLMSPWCVIG